MCARVCAVLHMYVWVCTGMHWHAQVCMYAGKHAHVHKCAQVCADFVKSLHFPPSMCAKTKVRKSMHRHAYVPTGEVCVVVHLSLIHISEPTRPY